MLTALLARLGLAQGLSGARAYLGCGLLVLLLCAALWARGSHYKHQRDDAVAGRQADRAAYTAAQAQAQALAEKAKADAETHYKELAHAADLANAEAAADARAAAERYIAQHRVLEVVGRPSRATPAAASGGSAGVPESVSTSAVVVSAEDVQACTGAVSYALSAREWALSLSGP
jgi:hypothetical protein